MTMTPLAPRTPYIVMSAASFSTRIDEMSYGLMPDSPPSFAGANGTPSTMYSGALLPLSDDEPPRMRIVRLPSVERPMVTPADRARRYFSIGSFGANSTSAAVAAGLGADAICCGSLVLGAEWAHAPMSASRASEEHSRRRAVKRERRASLVGRRIETT